MIVIMVMRRGLGGAGRPEAPGAVTKTCVFWGGRRGALGAGFRHRAEHKYVDIYKHIYIYIYIHV